MIHLDYRKLPTFGINPLTGEACAYMMRTLCDLNEEGAALMADYLGIPFYPKPGFAEPWNSQVNGEPSVGSIMIDRDAFHALMRFALFRAGCQYIYGHESSNAMCGFKDSDLTEYPDLSKYLDGAMAETQLSTFRLWRNQHLPGASVGSRNIHQMTGRTK